MAELTSGDVSVSIPARDRDIIPSGPKIMSMAVLVFGDGAKTYPAGGIPLPAMGMFGLKREIQFVAVEQPPANGFVYKVDRANHTLKIFTQGAVTGSTAAASSGNGALAENSAGAESAVRLSGTAVDTTYDLGGMLELPSTIAPASVSLPLVVIGE